MKIITIVLVLFITPLSTLGNITERGKGMLFGENHAFFATATHGWVLDNQSGVGQNLHMVFYPIGMTWADSKVIIYGRSVSKTESSTVEELKDKTIQGFRENGSPNYVGKKGTPLTLTNGSVAELYFFSGDKWGNFEAVAYFNEVETINYFVYNARNKVEFDRYKNDFLKIIMTYSNVYMAGSTSTKADVDALISRAEKELQDPKRKEYESKITQDVAKQMATFMKDCISYLPNEKLNSFHLIQQINGSGSITQSTVFPSTSLGICFRGLMSFNQYPRHIFDSFLLDINMSIKE